MPLKVGKSEKLMIFIKKFLSSFLQILMFFDRKLQHKIKFSTKSKRKSKNSSIQPRTSRPKFYDFSSNFSKISSFLWRKQAATGRTSPRARNRAGTARALADSERARSDGAPRYLSNRKIRFFLFFLLFSFSFLLESRKSELRRGGGGNFRGLFLGYIEIKFCK